MLLVPRSPRIPGAKYWLGAGLLQREPVLLLLGVTEQLVGLGLPKTIRLLGGLVVLRMWLQVERVVEEPLINCVLSAPTGGHERRDSSSSASRCSPPSRSSALQCRPR